LPAIFPGEVPGYAPGVPPFAPSGGIKNKEGILLKAPPGIEGTDKIRIKTDKIRSFADEFCLFLQQCGFTDLCVLDFCLCGCQNAVIRQDKF
jgi:hypothetical protein